MIENLPPCPFCGRNDLLKVIIDVSTHELRIGCFNCGAMGPNELSYELAVKMWGMRRVP